ncbi:MAG: acyl-CoA dehydrogenase family protein, partial [Thermodesulfobacteriota bacterium]|nr:acyl-CoA dehydrogenase family protein [Thermodesulfobacteriota bacterium]
MDFDFTEEQDILRKTANNFFANECGSIFVREMEKDEKGITPELWKKMSELGWMGVMFPEEYGGINGNFLDMIVLLSEMGYGCVHGPFFSTVVLSGLTILEAGGEKQKQDLLPMISNGSIFVTLALTEESATYTPDGISVKSVKDGDDYVINGIKLFVP